MTIEVAIISIAVRVLDSWTVLAEEAVWRIGGSDVGSERGAREDRTHGMVVHWYVGERRRRCCGSADRRVNCSDYVGQSGVDVKMTLEERREKIVMEGWSQNNG
ncbi:hypothetical protein ACFQE6_04375 [Natrinema soli]|uniref:Uncharacterized protein n=1 Tax=Natrinema soli TaxID=1930624 RepID=A0ABD5SL09_9EURY